MQEDRAKHLAYTTFLSLKSMADWIKDGDDSTSLFHQNIKATRLQNQIYSMHDEYGEWPDHPDFVGHAFLAYYEKLHGGNSDTRASVLQQLVQEGTFLTENHRVILKAPYTSSKVNKSLFSIPGCKAPDNDGFKAFFYKDAWSSV